MKRITALILIITVLLALSGCSRNNLAGKWEFAAGENKGIIEFFKNGKGEIYDAADSSGKLSFTYELLGKGRLKIVTDGNEEMVEYTIKDDNLTIISESDFLEGVRIK